VAIVFVAINLNQFTSKSASSGLIYGYIEAGREYSWKYFRNI